MVNETSANAPADARNVPETQNEQASSARPNRLAKIVRSPIFLVLLLVLIGAAAFVGYRYVQDLQSKVYIDTSEISAPVISVGPDVPGVLKTLYVTEGEHVVPGQQLFNVGDRVVSARVPGIVTSVQNTPGQWASNVTPIVQLYDPASLRVVGHVQEDQGLSDLRTGQAALFTVDAFPGKQYFGKVDAIANTPDQSSIVFSISDKRQEHQFDIKVAFDPTAYPELTNGMSARIWVYK